MQPDNMVYVRWQFNLYNDANTIEEEALIGIYGEVVDFPTTSGPALAVLADLASFARTHWESAFSAADFGLQLELAAVRAICQDTSGHTKYEQVSTAAPSEWRGSNSANALPWEDALVIGLYAYERGSFETQARSKRGRVYLSGLTTGAIAGGKSGLLSNTYVTNQRDALGTMLTALVGHTLTGITGSWHPGVLSKTHNYFNELAYLSVDNKVDAQRRREKQQTASISTVAWP